MEKVKLLTGNEAAAWAVKLAAEAANSHRNESCGFFSAGYPITPQTQTIEKTVEFLEKIEKARFENVESEHSAMAACVAASLKGLRTFTATSSQGLLLMYEMLHWAAKASLPIVMVNVNRAIGPPWNIWSEQTDSLASRDAGWLQFYCESPQEIFDTILQAYRLAENPAILAPAMICYSGFLLSHTAEPVILPSVEQVKAYLPSLDLPHKIDLKNSCTFFSSSNSYNYSEMQKDREERMEKAKKIIISVLKSFEDIFGRQASSVERIFFTENHRSDFEIITMGSLARPAKEALMLIKDLFPLSLTRIKMFLPFPRRQIINTLDNTKKIIVLNNSPLEVLTKELKNALYGVAGCKSDAPEIISRIIGIGGTEVSPEFLAEVIKEAITKGGQNDNLNAKWRIDCSKKPPDPPMANPENEQNKELIVSGHRACAGCGAIQPIKQALKVLGNNTIIVIPASCLSIIVGPYPASPLKVSVVHCPIETAGVTAASIKAASEIKGEEINVLVLAGDGGTADIGLQSLSGAAERGARIIYICYDNEAYMNTGRQRSSATPFAAYTETTPGGKRQFKKNIMEIMAAHRIPYAATCSIAFPEDFQKKLEKAKNFQKKGLCFLHVLCPCPSGWKHDPKNNIKIARLAVQSKIWPLYEIEDGRKYKITYHFKASEYGLEKTDLLEEYFKTQERFKNINQKDKELIKKYVQEEWIYLKRQEKIFVL
jgi:pyruvate/2-oxoacid:ferredoxin oxidoreductase alpha subunit/pyruvate/2-oxoacid:ferredoxin oxidoreductase beta subunit